MLVVAVLLSLLIPALASARGRMKALKCASNMRTTAFEFHLFAQGEASAGRGESAGRPTFQINDFQESLYRIAEFWDVGGAQQAVLRSSDEVMLCPP